MMTTTMMRKTRKRTTKISCDDCQDCFSKTKQRDYERNTLQLAVGYFSHMHTGAVRSVYAYAQLHPSAASRGKRSYSITHGHTGIFE